MCGVLQETPLCCVWPSASRQANAAHADTACFGADRAAGGAHVQALAAAQLRVAAPRRRAVVAGALPRRLLHACAYPAGSCGLMRARSALHRSELVAKDRSLHTETEHSGD